MLDIACPSCGGFGSVPKDKVNERLVCRKCHMAFHLTPAGRAVLGEPVRAGRPEPTRSATHAGKPSGSLTLSLPDLSLNPSLIKRLGFGVLAVVVLGMVLNYGRSFIASGPSLEASGRALAGELALDHETVIVESSLPETAPDSTIWCQLLRPVLEEMKANSADHSLDIAVSPRSGGVVSLFFGSEPSTERKAAILKAAAAAPTRTSLEVNTYWVRDGYGRWRLDGSRTLSVIPSLR